MFQGQPLQTLIVPAADLDLGAKKLNALEAQGVLKSQRHSDIAPAVGTTVRLSARSEDCRILSPTP